MNSWGQPSLGVIPILVGPLQVLMALLPVILVAVGSAVLALFKPRTIKLFLRLLWQVKVTVIIVVGIAAGVWFGARALWPRGSGKVGSADSTTNDWPLFRGSPLRTGAVPGTASPSAGRINWAFTETKTLYSSPAVVGNRVYITTAEKGPFTDRGAIYCIDADTGGIVWKSAPDRYLATYSSPSVSGRYLVVGEGLHMTREARVICLDVDRSGSVLWTYTTKSHVESSPALAGGRAYIGAGDDGYYCFRLEPDSAGKPVMEWHLTGDRYPDAETSPAVADGRVFFGLGVNGHAVVCADAASGNEIWRVPTPSPVFTPPALAHGKVLVGMGHGNVILSEEEVIAETREKLRKAGRTDDEISALTKSMTVHGAVWCIDQATDRVEWKFATDRTVLGGVAAGVDRVFAATRAGTVYAIGYDGRELARWEARVPIIAAPALTDMFLYVVATDGRLYGLNKASLQPVWQVALGSGANYVSSPAIARGHVYVGTTDNGLLCVGAPGGSDSKPLWAANLGGGDFSGCIDGSPLPEIGGLFWIHPPTDDTGKTKPLVVSSPSGFVGNRLFVPCAGGLRTGLLCLEVKPGGQSDPVEKWFYRTTNGVSAAAVTDGERVFIVDGATGAEGRKLHCVGVKSGKAEWAAAVDAEASGAMTLAPDGLLVQDRASGIVFLGHDGKEKWRARIGGMAMPAAIDDDVLVLSVAGVRPADGPSSAGITATAVGDSGEASSEASRHGAMVPWVVRNGALLALDRPTGAVLWKRDMDVQPVTAPVLDGRQVYLGTRTAVCAYSLRDGAPVWTAKSDPPGAGVIARAGEALVYSGAKGGLIVLETKDGGVRKVIPGALATVPPLVTRDALLYATKDSLMLVRWNLEKPVQWMDTSWLGNISTAPVMGESTVFFGTDQYGVVCAGKGR